ncbi:MAG: DUF2809 domain-containing protein [Clostridium sp.]
MKRKRVIYFILIIITMILGILSRKSGQYLPDVIAKYSGDTLWSLMVYLGIGFIFPKMNIKHIFILTLMFSYTIEISQLYQAAWINNIRNTTLGALILGHGFLFSDLVCYTVGITIGGISEIIYLKEKM